ncbi:Smr/MutS family protein [Novosphingobium rhizovicinum]|uniref:Smr/MutS family protein n=1 Tax=Novosphingobium rhizovicinum TaxID=3228928 RepID=UPI003B02CE01
MADTVTPLRRAPAKAVEVPLVPAAVAAAENAGAANAPSSPKRQVERPLLRPPPTKPASSPAKENKVGLDASWERKIARGGIEPDFSLDLHGATLDQAYGRLMHGLTQAKSMGARVVLIVAGKPRPTEFADRATARGAIRAKLVDWLGASSHAHSIAAIRGAHRRHGGTGAVYVILKRSR